MLERQGNPPECAVSVGTNHRPCYDSAAKASGGDARMNVIVVASRKGGSGKSTLTAHLAAHASKPSRPTLLIDADPQGSLTLWHELRGTGEPALKSGLRGIAETVKAAKREGYAWTFIDTP